jgi:signal peptidase II
MEASYLDPSEAHPTEPSSRPDAEAPAGRRRTALFVFALIACTIAASDQLLKRWIVAHYDTDVPLPVLGEWFRIHFIHNNGGLFGLFQGQAPIFALITVGVVVVLVALQIGSGWRSWLVTVTLGLLLGGAVGNFIDRIRLGYVVDFADIGIGTWRFYIFNIADSAVTVAILLMFVMWFIAPHLGVHMPTDEDGDGAAGRDSADAGSLKVR